MAPSQPVAEVTPPKEWRTGAPRSEISPAFSFDPQDGKDGSGCFSISSDEREGLHGWWMRSFPLKGGDYYQVTAFYRTTNVSCPRRSVLTRVLWRDDSGRPVDREAPTITKYLPNWTPPPADAEYLEEKEASGTGWIKVSGIYRAPARATQAIVELDFQWASNAKAEWSGISFAHSAAPPERKARLATVHFEPQGGKNALENCRMFKPLIAEAAQQKADLVVLGEHVTAMGICPAVEMAEPIPGPSSDFFGQLASKHNLYIVVGLVEREGALIYNTAVLMDPDGKLAGKYRKVTLPTSEFEKGMAPGHEYPVFDTRFGKLGIMICYDAFFPEVAQRLSMNGAEVIAWPVYGCNPLLASARACENQVYLVSSSYGKAANHWGISGIYDLEGNVIAQTEKRGSVVMAEVDLNKRTYWTGLGDWKNTLLRHHPV